MALWKLLHLYCLVIWLLKRQHCGNMYTLAHKLSQRRKKRQTEKEWPPKVRKQNSCCLFRNFFIPEIRLSPSESPPLFQVVNAFRPLTVVCNQCVWVCLWSIMRELRKRAVKLIDDWSMQAPPPKCPGSAPKCPLKLTCVIYLADG